MVWGNSPQAVAPVPAPRQQGPGDPPGQAACGGWTLQLGGIAQIAFRGNRVYLREPEYDCKLVEIDITLEWFEMCA